MTSDSYKPDSGGVANHEQRERKQRRSSAKKKRKNARVLRDTVNGQAGKKGQPTLFKPIYIRMCKRLASAGLTDDEMAAHLGVASSTFDDWKARYPALLKVLKLGKASADNRVERSLYRRALGYTVKAQKPFVDKFGDEHVVEHLEHVEPDTTAAIFFLKNRRPDMWRDRMEHSLFAPTTPDQLKQAWARVESVNGKRDKQAAPASRHFKECFGPRLLEYRPISKDDRIIPPDPGSPKQEN